VRESIFERVVCGVDGSPASLEAVRQADLLLADGGRLTLLASVNVTQAIHFQVAPTAIHAARRARDEVEELGEELRAALDRSRAEATHAGEVATEETGGPPADALLDAAAADHATLLAVGTHGLGRVAGVLLGSVATRVVHRAPCPVLLARPRRTGRWSPDRVVVGVDGSPSSDAALDACRELESRFGSIVEQLTVTGRRPAHTLVEAAASADLVALGARAAGHVPGLGSVAERVAHHAACSVLVVRSAADA
jgi:nucleotide-binding universal stress UspA family protein